MRRNALNNDADSTMEPVTLYVTQQQGILLQQLQQEASAQSLSQDELVARLEAIVGPEMTAQIGQAQDEGKTIRFSRRPATEDELTDLGFAGLLVEGLTPEQARDRIAQNLRDNEEVLTIMQAMRRENPEAFEQMRQAWLDHGVTPPWEDEL
jgi:hypothetical protein